METAVIKIADYREAPARLQPERREDVPSRGQALQRMIDEARHMDVIVKAVLASYGQPQGEWKSIGSVAEEVVTGMKRKRRSKHARSPG